jgi:hypothetical protein
MAQKSRQPKPFGSFSRPRYSRIAQMRRDRRPGSKQTMPATDTRPEPRPRTRTTGV